MNDQLITPFGDFNLKRIPDSDKNLYAWNSADRYLLNHLFELYQSDEVDLDNAKILIINDAFGALSVPMAQFSCDSYSDSVISHQAIIQNIKQCCPENLDKVTLLKSTEQLQCHYDVVLFKEVKNYAFFQDEMLKVAQYVNPNTLILGGIMAKNLQKNTMELLNKSIGQTQASLAWKKARLLFVNSGETGLDEVKVMSSSVQLETNISTYELDESNEIIYNLANVFSKNKLDIGTRFFLQHLPNEKNYKNIIDLGCGNGVLSLKIAQNYPKANITCIDESYMAVASAKMTLEANLQAEDVNITYKAANALSDYPQNSTDLILCNPPFHQQYVVGDAIAWQMFKQSKKTLVKGGELWIVGNRHLAYHLKLQKIFGNHEFIAANNKFVVLKAVNN
ncbi:MAG: methyltransferase [gamma proteobacterium symbiont of Lucinoma myriamae]|nr:methyltransferase [gamma proteobacterium symbiont of Lucinoma myriamae]MCU7819466.1 methyltransferase [gamma proteobacterium symbiont of Lucinoma myriamae]MCU7831573.1 methyltransferase [gamma proteobacterium symbiont of Lucinoma myriamae]